MLNGWVTLPLNVGEVDQNVVYDYQLWRSPDGQVWTVTIDNYGNFVTGTVTPLTTESGRVITTEAGAALLLED